MTVSIDQWLKMRDETVSVPVWFQVTGSSMFPLIRANRDRVMLVSVDPAELKAGDIVLFPGKYKGGSYCLHRIYRTDKDAVQTLGDGNRVPDQWQSRENILGKAVLIRRGRLTIDCESRQWQRCFKIWNRLLRIRPVLLLPFKAVGKLEQCIRRIAGKSSGE